MVKNLPAMQETLDQEDLLEKGLAIHFSVLACRIPWTEEPGGLQFIRSQRAGHDGSDSAAANSFTGFVQVPHPHQSTGNSLKGGPDTIFIKIYLSYNNYEEKFS